MTQKLFGIGLSHTGTRSLSNALDLLGYKSIHWATDRRTYCELSNGVYDLSILKDADALTDITAAPFYAQFDKVYPGSKFILTLRDTDKWVKRMTELMPMRETIDPSTFRKYAERFLLFSRRKGGAHRFMFSYDFLRYLRHEPGIVRRIEFQELVTYGGLRFRDEVRLRYVYETHERNVREYFANRPDDLLIMNVTAGDGWEALCRFLKKSIPEVAFPHLQ